MQSVDEFREWLESKLEREVDEETLASEYAAYVDYCYETLRC